MARRAGVRYTHTEDATDRSTHDIIIADAAVVLQELPERAGCIPAHSGYGLIPGVTRRHGTPRHGGSLKIWDD